MRRLEIRSWWSMFSNYQLSARIFHFGYRCLSFRRQKLATFRHSTRFSNFHRLTWKSFDRNAHILPESNASTSNMLSRTSSKWKKFRGAMLIKLSTYTVVTVHGKTLFCYGNKNHSLLSSFSFLLNSRTRGKYCWQTSLQKKPGCMNRNISGVLFNGITILV